MDSEAIVKEVVDDIFECPFYSEAQVQKATRLVDEKLKENRKLFAKGLLDLPLDEMLSLLEEVANG